MKKMRMTRNHFYLLIGSIIAINGLLAATLFLRNSLINKLENNRAIVTEANALVSNLKTIDEGYLGRDAGLSGYVSDLESKVNVLKNSKLYGTDQLACLSSPGVCERLRSFNAASITKMDSLEKDLEKYSQTTTELVKFLQYSPSADLALFNPNDPNELERLARARSGLEESSNKLYSLDYGPATLAAVEINKSKNGISKIKTKDDVQTWSKEVTSSQKKILEFLNKEVDRIKSQSYDLRLILENF